MSSKVIRKEQCPECAKHGKDTHQNNLAVYDDGHSFCFSCNYLFNERGGFNPLNEDTFTYEYLAHRGIRSDIYKKYNVLTKIDKDGKPIEVGFPHPDGSTLIRSLASKTFVWDPPGSKAKAGLFGMDKFPAGSHKYVIITEGQYDALSMFQVCGGVPAVSVHSSVTALADVSNSMDWLRSFERCYLALDGDVQGRDAVRKVAPLFDYNNLFVVNFTNRKDANEYVQAGEDNELHNIWKNARKYLPDEVESSLVKFREILKEAPKMGVPYPFPALTKMTYGIRRGESVLITAQEKVGKTELMHVIEHNILKETDDAVAAIYLEEPPKRHLQALAGVELGVPAHLPGQNVGPEQVAKALENLVRVDDRLHVYTHFGSDDPDHLLETIRFLVVSRNVVYVFLDHISMVVSGLSGEDERKAIDYICTRLQMMVKELGFSLIFVSHLNDFGQTRGSRWPVKICDVHIRMERDKLNPDPVIRNTAKLTLIDNRYCGQTGPVCELEFDPSTYLFKEKAANDNFEFMEKSA